MKLIKPSFNIIEQGPGIDGIYKIIEQAGRTCYKSEDKITEDSAKEFVDRMIKSGHGAMLEHGTVYLMIYTIDPKDWDKTIARQPHITIDDSRDYLRTNPTYDSEGKENWWAKTADHIANEMVVKYADNQYSKVKIVTTKHEVNTEGGIIITPTGEVPIITKGSGKVISVFNTILITTNLRVLVENNWLDDLKYLCEPTEYHERRITVHFVLPIGISREFCRHRVMSFAEQSTRYCNFSSDKFNNELTFIEDAWCDEELLRQIEYWYINSYLKPQEKRNMLPLCTKTELVMTGFISDWKHFFSLRDAVSAHPQAQELAKPLHEEFIKNGWL